VSGCLLFVRDRLLYPLLKRQDDDEDDDDDDDEVDDYNDEDDGAHNNSMTYHSNACFKYKLYCAIIRMTYKRNVYYFNSLDLFSC